MNRSRLNAAPKIIAILILATIMYLSVDLLNYKSVELTTIGYIVEIGGLLGIIYLTYSIIKNKNK